MNHSSSAAIHRRRFLQLGAVALLSSGKGGAYEVKPPPPLRLGCVAGAIKRQLKEDWRSTLQQVAEAGFREIECSDPIGPSYRECKLLLDDLGLRAIAGGTGLIKLEESFAEIVEHSHALGKTYVASYWPWRDDGKNKTAEDYLRLAHQFNLIGGRLKRHNLRFIFHHHDLEFLPLKTGLPCDLLLANTDPSLVSMTLDAFWTAIAGVDPLPYLLKHQERIAILHLGDRARNQDRTVACLGEGDLTLEPLIRVAGTLSDLHVMIENPDATTGMECLVEGYKYVRNLRV